jgi:hypothetical protein
MTITLFGAVGTLISFTVISLGRFTPSLSLLGMLFLTWHSGSALNISLLITGALGLISKLYIGELDLGDYLG